MTAALSTALDSALAAARQQVPEDTARPLAQVGVVERTGREAAGIAVADARWAQE